MNRREALQLIAASTSASMGADKVSGTVYRFWFLTPFHRPATNPRLTARYPSSPPPLDRPHNLGRRYIWLRAEKLMGRFAECSLFQNTDLVAFGGQTQTLAPLARFRQSRSNSPGIDGIFLAGVPTDPRSTQVQTAIAQTSLSH